MPKQGHMEYMKGQNSEVQPQVWKNISYREKNKENNTQKTIMNSLFRDSFFVPQPEI